MYTYTHLFNLSSFLLPFHFPIQSQLNGLSGSPLNLPSSIHFSPWAGGAFALYKWILRKQNGRGVFTGADPSTISVEGTREKRYSSWGVAVALESKALYTIRLWRMTRMDLVIREEDLSLQMRKQGSLLCLHSIWGRLVDWRRERGEAAWPTIVFSVPKKDAPLRPPQSTLQRHGPALSGARALPWSSTAGMSEWDRTGWYFLRLF